MSAYLHDTPTLDLTVVAPLYNEVDNAGPLADDIVREVSKLGISYEVILVNDGSSDATGRALDEAAARHERVQVIHFRRNCGQTIAIAAGMYHARGRNIVLLDGDRQNDPADIGMLLARLNEGFDCVSGWRKDRQDSGMRRLPSQVANWIVNRVTGVPVHDLGCTLKAYRREALDPTELFGEMHRFLAVYVQARGGKIAEMVVRHHPRTAGVSKYGLSRAARVVGDLLLIRVLHKYRTRPSHLLAKIAQYMFLPGAALALWGLLAVIWNRSIVAGAWQFLAALVLAVGAAVVLCVGVVCELVLRGAYLATGRHPWEIARTVGFDDAPR